MINIWEYAEDLPFVEIRDVNGEVFVGEMIHVSDAEEAEAEEDEAVVEAPSGEIRIFPVSKIASITRTERKCVQGNGNSCG
ncbi:MAG: hypothetical protein IKC24_06465 [Oscillospiraceae bacterium]|nr:hypothetical protein [Oscillospiraceae bacterium]